MCDLPTTSGNPKAQGGSQAQVSEVVGCRAGSPWLASHGLIQAAGLLLTEKAGFLNYLLVFRRAVLVSAFSLCAAPAQGVTATMYRFARGDSYNVSLFRQSASAEVEGEAGSRSVLNGSFEVPGGALTQGLSS